MSYLYRVLCVSCLTLIPALPAIAQTADDPVAHGHYIAQIAGCFDCHSPRGENGAPQPEKGLIGGTIGFEMPGLGIFWPPNLTSDPAALGEWSDEDIITAIRTGKRPDGRMLTPIMPWPAFAVMTDSDVTALVAYLRAAPKVANQVPPIAANGDAAKGPYFSVVMPK